MVGIPGHIYILSNPAMPGLLHIGSTVGSPSQLAAALSRSPAVPSRFEVEHAEQCADHELAEPLLLEAFEIYRVSSDRAFFQLAAGRAIEIVADVVSLVDRAVEARRVLPPPQPPATPPDIARCSICGGALIAAQPPEGERRCANPTCFGKFPRSYPRPMR
jgi:hypothetical protein